MSSNLNLFEDICFIGGVIPKEQFEVLRQKTRAGFQFAANNLQESLILGFDFHNVSIEMISVPFIPSYPSGTDLLFYKGSAKNNRRYLSFINLPLIRELHRSLAIFYHLVFRKVGKPNRNFFVYSMSMSLLLPVVFYSFFYRKSTISLYILDLPEMMNFNKKKNFFYSAFKKLEVAFLKVLLKRVKFFFVVSKHITEALDLPSERTLVVEGVSSESDVFSTCEDSINGCDDFFLSKYKYVFYSGGIFQSYGIEILLDAAALAVDTDIKFVFCGKGDFVEKIISASEINLNVIYLGEISTESVVRLQRYALCLVNPRDPKQTFTKYSFPSKILEYMKSGRPVVSYRLPGIPDEYFKYLIDPGVYNADALFISILKFYNNDPTWSDSLGKKTKEFVECYKSRNVITGKILEFLRGY